MSTTIPAMNTPYETAKLQDFTRLMGSSHPTALKRATERHAAHRDRAADITAGRGLVNGIDTDPEAQADWHTTMATIWDQLRKGAATRVAITTGVNATMPEPLDPNTITHLDEYDPTTGAAARAALATITD
ncbi:hypothetical protein [Actinomyces provencensis]|uniref:hypothetical protein n=1 Tax=Actinomyces provencensis TaxID=1720198 RepID=UPI00096A62D4|nr:hypothetical protein [Actinomyces provencensis]